MPTAFLLFLGSTTHTATELGTLAFVKVVDPVLVFGIKYPKLVWSIATKKLLRTPFRVKPDGVTISIAAPFVFVNFDGTSKNMMPREFAPLVLVVHIKP